MSENHLYNEDLAPVDLEHRTWGVWNIAALWIGMSVCVPTYMLAAGLISAGMNWLQALFTIALANVIVLIPMVLNAHAGTKYGIPFPVLLRSSFGVIGANIPAVMRALVACGWFGIQTWVGGAAIYTLSAALIGFTPATEADALPLLGISFGQFACFMIFWAINIAIIIAGIESIKWFESLTAPLLLLGGLLLLFYTVSQAGGFGVVFSEETLAKLRGSQSEEFSFWAAFPVMLTANVGFWATLALNIPDFTRYAKSQKEQMMGQALGLPTTMALFSFIGIAVTSATVVLFGEAIWDPVALLGKFTQPMVVIISMVLLSIATLSTNIAANVVGPANDFSNLAPDKISFRTGGIITGIIGIVIMPWKLLSDLGAYIFTWLIGYSSLLGAIAGIMLIDYFFIKRQQLDVDDLYERNGKYSFGPSGINGRAVLALLLGILPCLPGFLFAATNSDAMYISDNYGMLGTFFADLYQYAWFVSLGIAATVHLLLNKGQELD